MGFWFEIKNMVRRSWFLILAVITIFYFGSYAIYGERGVRKYLYLRHEVEYAQNLANQYKNQKEQLNTEVKLLSPESLDLDLLDERVRVVLNFVEKDEFVILDEYE